MDTKFCKQDQLFDNLEQTDVIEMSNVLNIDVAELVDYGFNSVRSDTAEEGEAKHKLTVHGLAGVI